MKPHAYTYIRWSSAEQAAGSSLARQRERIAQIAAGTGLPIAELEIDDGVSAATGKNQRSGPLAEFLALVDAGRVAPGSALCVEDVDRLSRAGPLNTLQLVDRLARRGVRVVTGDGVFDLNDAGSSIAGTVKSILAQLENAKKSKRVADAWRKKRDAAKASGGVYHGSVPAWVRVGKTGYVIDSTAAATVRKIFKLSAQGHGAQRIANLFNSEAVPLIGKRPARAWFASYVRRIIRGRGVLGEVTTSTGDTLHVYPQIITAAQWHAAQHAFKPRGRPSAQERNLFRGLIFSGRDGSSMQHRHKPPYSYLTSADTLEKRSLRPHSVTYREDELVEWITTYGPRAIARTQSEAPERLDELRAEVAEAERKLGNLLALAEAGELPRSVLARITEAENARDKAQAALAEAEAKQITAAPVPIDLKTPAGRARWRRDVARVITAIWIDDDEGRAVRVQFRGESVAWSGTLPDRLHDDEAVIGKLTHLTHRLAQE